MRLSDVLSKPKSNDFQQIEAFLGERRFGVGQYRKIDIGKIILNLPCECGDEASAFSSSSKMHCTMVDASTISIDCVIVCLKCNQAIPIWFLVEFEGDPFLPAPKARILKYSLNLPVFSHRDSEFSLLFQKAEQAYQDNLGAGSIVYLRKILERITIQVATSEGVDIHTAKGKRRNFSEILKDTDERCSFIPKEFSQNGYKLFSELSNVIHGSFDESLALQKYTAWHRLVTGVVENVKNSKELTRATSELDW